MLTITSLTGKGLFVNGSFKETNENIKIVFSYIDKECGSELTTDEAFAMSHDKDYEIASVDELHEYVAFCGHIFEGILLVKEGIVRYYELPETEFDDFECGYEFVTGGGLVA